MLVTVKTFGECRGARPVAFVGRGQSFACHDPHTVYGSFDLAAKLALLINSDVKQILIKNQHCGKPWTMD